MNYNTVKKREPNFFHQWCETLIKSYDYCFNQFQSKGNLCKIFKLRKLSKLKKNKNKTTLELFVSFTHKLQMWQFRKFQNSHNSPWFMFTVRDMCLHRLHISFVVQTKHVSFTVIYHSVSLQINKKNTALPLLVLNFISNYSYIKHRDTPKHVCPLTNNFNVWRIEECDVYKTN